MQLKTILNRVHRCPGFVYREAQLLVVAGVLALHVQVVPDARTRANCSGCGEKRPGYDTLEERMFEFVPLWNIAVFFLYAMRRVKCAKCGIIVEAVPWASGKSHRTNAYAWFLAGWALRMSWLEDARAFRPSWENDFRSVETAVEWALREAPVDYHGQSDFGRAFSEFARAELSGLDSRTTVLILGDARNNYHDPQEWALRRIRERVKGIIWLNPQGQREWGLADSAMPVYASCCDVLRECRTVRQLAEVVESLVGHRWRRRG